MTNNKQEEIDLTLFHSKIPATLDLETGMLSSPVIETEIYIDKYMNLVGKARMHKYTEKFICLN